jgi:alpha-glucosidase (family GH31 glycosyl hydrolase)
MAWRAYNTGLAPILPMYYGDVSPAAFACPDQYYFGSELVAAPVVTPSRPSTGRARKRVWLPAGQWTNFFTGESLEGGCWHTLHPALEEIPVFARPGAIVPHGPKVGWGGTGNPDELDVFIFPGASNRFELYEDDGENTGYQHGEYALTPFSLEQGEGALTFTILPAQGDHSFVPSQRTYRVHLRGVDADTACVYPASYDSITRTLNLGPVTLKPGETFNVRFTNIAKSLSDYQEESTFHLNPRK